MSLVALTEGTVVRVVNAPYAELQVKVCYFCQHCESASSTSMPQCFPSGYQDSLFLLNPDEQPLCAADALLLFCIDISGSMSITSQVKPYCLLLGS